MTKREELLKMFGVEDIPLADVAERILKISPAHANRLANAMAFPFPVYKLDYSNKGKWFVHIDGLAIYLENKRWDAVEDWKKIHGKNWHTIPITKGTSG